MITQNIIMAAIGGYMLGSIPFGLVLTRLTGGGDVRDIGSGNIGATNVLRTGRKDIALLTLLLDAGKAGIAALIFSHLFGLVPSLVAGGAALIGHCYPVWLKFKGGKGVATYFGVLFAVAWPIGLVAAAAWITSAFITRIVSLAGILTSIIVPIAAYFMGHTHIAILAAVLGAVIILRHAANLGRILKGTEPKINKKKSESK